MPGCRFYGRELEMELTDKQDNRIKVIFNPHSGANKDSPSRLEKVIENIQDLHYRPEVYVMEPKSNLTDMIHDALSKDISLFAACGGDGTISAVARELAGKDAVLGIIPSGTQNNIAFSLGIPSDIPAAVSLLRMGRRSRIDMGMLTCGKKFIPFLELCSVGLLSTVFPACDEIQHGNLMRVGDLLSGLVSAPEAEFYLVLNGDGKVEVRGGMLLVANMPFVIRHFQVSEAASFQDGLLDLILFADIPKIGLMKVAITGPSTKTAEDPRIHHFPVRSADIITDPAMPVMADGKMLGEAGHVHMEIQSLALSVMLPDSDSRQIGRSGETNEK